MITAFVMQGWIGYALSHGVITTYGGPIYIMGTIDLILKIIVIVKTKKAIFQKMAVKYLGLVEKQTNKTPLMLGRWLQ